MAQTTACPFGLDTVATNPEKKKSPLDATFIIPVNNDALLDRIQRNLIDRFTDFEVVPVRRAASFYDAWRKGLEQASKQYLILTHQDVLFNSIPSLASLFIENVGLVGVAGSKVITDEEPFWFTNDRHQAGKLSGSIYQGKRGLQGKKTKFGPCGEVVVLDGVCLVTTPELMERFGLLNKRSMEHMRWQFYDHVLSLEMRNNGIRVITADIDVYHESDGLITNNYEEIILFRLAQSVFVKEYFEKSGTTILSVK